MLPSSKSSQMLKIKTQKALQAVNDYQVIKNQSILFRTGLVLTKNLDTLNSYTKQFEVKEVVRLQLLPKSRDLFNIKYNHKLQPKIIIKNVRGGPFDLNIYYDKQSLLRKVHTQKFTIKDEIMIKLETKKLEDAKQIYYEFLNGSNLTMCNFRMDLVPKKKRRNGLRTQKSEETLVTILQQIKQKSPKNNQIKSKSLRKSNVNFYNEEDLQILKPENRKKQLQRQKQIEEERKLAIIQRKEKAQIFKEKEIEAKRVAAKCRVLVQNYEETVDEETRLKRIMIKQNAHLFAAIKFGLFAAQVTIERQKQQNRIFMVQFYRNSFQRKLKKSYEQTTLMVPSSTMRQKAVINVSLIFLGKSLQLKDYKKSSEIVSKVVLNSLAGILLNNTMNAANKYRRYVRVVQKIWRTKFQARMELLLIYSERQLASIFKKFPQFKVLEDDFRKQKIAGSICYQYQAETAVKIKDLFLKYEKKIQQIQEYKKINEQIKKFNETALKKRVKELLEVPKEPCYPQHRFFRDLMVLKNMLRSWFQVEYRRWKKTNKSKVKIQGKQ